MVADSEAGAALSRRDADHASRRLIHSRMARWSFGAFVVTSSMSPNEADRRSG
jgi:hypothetical protein